MHAGGPFDESVLSRKIIWRNGLADRRMHRESAVIRTLPVRPPRFVTDSGLSPVSWRRITVDHDWDYCNTWERILRQPAPRPSRPRNTSRVNSIHCHLRWHPASRRFRKNLERNSSSCAAVVGVGGEVGVAAERRTLRKTPGSRRRLPDEGSASEQTERGVGRCTPRTID